MTFSIILDIMLSKKTFKIAGFPKKSKDKAVGETVLQCGNKYAWCRVYQNTSIYIKF